MSERDSIWIKGSILADVLDLSLLTSTEKEVLLKFRGLYAKYMENEAIYRRFSNSDDECDKALCAKAYNSNLSITSELYELLETVEIKRILELQSLDESNVEQTPSDFLKATELFKNVFCWKCGEKLPDDGNCCVKCGAKADVFDEVLNLAETSARTKQRFELDPYMRKKIIKISIVFVVAIFILVLIINSAVHKTQNAQLRNFATENMSEEYTNVYADVLSIEPEYFVYSSYDGGLPMISEVVCKCETIEGLFIWVTISDNDYPDGGFFEYEYEPKQYDAVNPLRLTGRVTTSEDVMEELENSIGDIFVLDVRDLQQQVSSI